MVEAGVGGTLLAELPVTPPVPASPAVPLFASATAPSPEVAMFWRRDDRFRDLLSATGAEIRAVARPLVGPTSACRPFGRSTRPEQAVAVVGPEGVPVVVPPLHALQAGSTRGKFV
jgi:hypothetical protein